MVVFLFGSLRKRRSLSLGTAELKMNAFLVGILQETEEPELGGSRALNKLLTLRDTRLGQLEAGGCAIGGLEGASHGEIDACRRHLGCCGLAA